MLNDLMLCSLSHLAPFPGMETAFAFAQTIFVLSFTTNFFLLKFSCRSEKKTQGLAVCSHNQQSFKGLYTTP